VKADNNSLGHEIGVLSAERFSGLGFRRFLQEAPHSFGRLGSTAEPIVHPLPLEYQLRRLTARVVMTQDFHKATVSSLFPVNDHDSIATLLFGSRTSQPYS